jgi:uncharacterized protein involved in tellurium resistance
MERWGPDRTIEASVIRDVLLGRKAPNADPHGVQLRGLRISGPLDLYNVQSDLDLSLSDCLIESGVILRRARLRMISFTGCVIMAGANRTCLDGQQVAVAALHLNESTFDASDSGTPIDLRYGQVRGSLILSGAQLNGHDSDGDSLIGDGLTVDGAMSLGTSGRSAFTATGAIRLPRANIGGELNLSGAQLNGHDGNGNSLFADGLTVDGGMFIRTSGKLQFTSAGAIRIPGAHIGGQLDLSDVQLTGRDINGNSLFGDGLTVDGSMFLRSSESSSTVAGVIRLPGAHIGGQLAFAGAQLKGDDNDGNSLLGDGLIVDGDMLLRHGDGSPFTAAGAIRLLGARIGGQLTCSGAQLNGRDTDGDSLIGDKLTVDGSMLLRTGGGSAFTAAGAIRLPGARIGGQLSLAGAQLNGCDLNGNCLNGDGLIVDGDMYLRPSGESAFNTAGTIQLVRARILGQLQVPLGSAQGVVLSLATATVGELSLDLTQPFNADTRLDLKDATYAGLSRLDNLDQWLRMLRHHTQAYTPQAYQQLATVHRAAGHERDARRILIAQQEDRRQRVVRADNGASRWTRFRFWARRAGLWLQKVTIGYGYRTWPAFVGVLVLAALGAGLGIAAGHTHAGTTKRFAAYRPASAIRRTNQNCSTIEQAALGVRVPFLSSLGTGDCVLDTTSLTGGFYSAGIWTDQALAWAAATLAVAGYTGLVRRT